MFDVGFWELALIGIVALLVVGPEKMPGLIRTAGQWAGQVQRLARDLRRDIELEAQTEEYKALNQEFMAEDKRLKELARNPGKAITDNLTGNTESATSSSATGDSEPPAPEVATENAAAISGADAKNA